MVQYSQSTLVLKGFRNLQELCNRHKMDNKVRGFSTVVLSNESACIRSRDTKHAVGDCCMLTESKCNYTAVMPSMINDVGL